MRKNEFGANRNGSEKKTELQPPISKVSSPETLFLKILRKDSTSSTLIGMVNPEATGYVCKLGN